MHIKPRTVRRFTPPGKNPGSHPQSVYGFGHQAYYHQVADYLQKKGPKPTGGEDGLNSLALIRRI